MVVNRTFQRQMLEGREAMAAAVRVIVEGDTLEASVVGVVPDLADQVISMPSEPAVYLPAAVVHGATRYLIVRGRTASAGLLPAVDATLRAELPQSTVGRGAWLDELRRDLYAQETLLALLARFVTVLAAAAGVLALVGLHALLRLAVERERPTAALRLALGAAPPRVGTGLLTEVVLLGVVAVGRASRWRRQRAASCSSSSSAWRPRALVRTSGRRPVCSRWWWPRAWRGGGGWRGWIRRSCCGEASRGQTTDRMGRAVVTTRWYPIAAHPRSDASARSIAIGLRASAACGVQPTIWPRFRGAAPVN